MTYEIYIIVLLVKASANALFKSYDLFSHLLKCIWKFL